MAIRKTSKGWVVESEEGKNLGGPYPSREQAISRLREVEFFKHKDRVNEKSRRAIDKLGAR